MTLTLIRDAVRSFSTRTLTSKDPLTRSIHKVLREKNTPAAVLAVLVRKTAFTTLLGNSTELRLSDSSGERLVVDGVSVGLHYSPSCDKSERPGQEWRDCEVVVQTNYEKYVIYACATKRNAEFVLSWSDEAETLEESLRYHGGLVRLARCADWSILSRSIAIDLPAGNLLSRGYVIWSRKSRPVNRLRAFLHHGATLKTVLDVHDELFTNLTSSQRIIPDEAFDSQRRMLHPGLSPTLNYRGSVGVPERGDYIATYTSRKGDQECREFLIDLNEKSRHASDLRLLEYSLLYLMGIRRTKLFRANYGSRLYSVILPAALLFLSGHPVLAVVPLVSLTKLPNSAHFRNTVGLTLIVVPVDVDNDDALVARRPSLAEVTEISADLTRSGTTRQNATRYVMGGPLAKYLASGPQFSIPELAAEVAETLASSTCAESVARRTRARRSAAKGLAESSIGSICYLVDLPGGDRAPWAAWSSGAEDEIFERILHRAIFYSDHVNPTNAFSTWESVDFRSLSVGNAHGADMSGLTFYNPQMDTKFVLYPTGAEQYPNHSVLRWFAWQVYLDVAFSCVRALLGRFHDNMETVTDLRRALRAIQALSTELAEVYDLDLSDFFYRREYERLRSILRLDSDYDYMRTRLTSAQGVSSLREQVMMNNLVLALTLASVLAATIVAIGQLYRWGAVQYFYGAAATIGASLVIGFGFFGPLRWFAGRIRSLVVNRKR